MRYNVNVESDRKRNDADWCNGSTADSDSVSRGSSPLSVACKTVIKAVLFLCPEYVTVYSCRGIFTVVFGEKNIDNQGQKEYNKAVWHKEKQLTPKPRSMLISYRRVKVNNL